MAYRDYRKLSRDSDLGTKDVEISLNQINTGSLLRMADAIEKLCQSRQKLEIERDMYKRWYDKQIDNNYKLCRQNAGLRGYITRLKKKLK
jgi:hypothetical protein